MRRPHVRCLPEGSLKESWRLLIWSLVRLWPPSCLLPVTFLRSHAFGCCDCTFRGLRQIAANQSLAVTIVLPSTSSASSPALPARALQIAGVSTCGCSNFSQTMFGAALQCHSRGIIVGGGTPCQPLSKLNRSRQCLRDPRAQAPAFLRDLVRALRAHPQLAEIEVILFLENVASMDSQARDQFSAWAGAPPVSSC